MAKTLKDFLEGYLKVKSADEQKFIDKHVTAKTADRNGNGDDVFNGNTKTIDRRKDRKGYNPGEDEKVYEGLSESTYEFDVSGEDGKAGVDKFVKHANSKGIKAKVHTYDGPAGGNPVVHLTHKDPKALHSYVNTHMYPVHDISKHKINEALKGNQHKIDANKNGKVDAHDFKLLRGKKKVAEEAEELDEISTNLAISYRGKAGEDKTKDRSKGRKLALDKWSGKAKVPSGKYFPGKYNEEVEELEELSDTTLDNYKEKASKEIRDAEDNDDIRHYNKRMHGYTSALKAGQRNDRRDVKKTTKEEVKIGRAYKVPVKSPQPLSGGKVYKEKPVDSKKLDAVGKKIGSIRGMKEEVELDEKLTAKTPMGKFIKDFTKSNAPQFKGKSQAKRRVMAIAAKLTAERGGKPLNKEERLQDRLSDISESHQRVMLNVFGKLNEDNKTKFMTACATPEGVEQMLDFAITYRGE